MLVIAFDGVLFDSLTARANAVIEATSAFIDVAGSGAATVLETLPGLSIAECVRTLMTNHANETREPIDETAVDIASLSAERIFAANVRHGFTINVRARDMLVRGAAVTRVVLRADSRRSEVDHLLLLAGLDLTVSMIRCSDDGGSRGQLMGGITSGGSTSRDSTSGGRASIDRSYTRITQKLASNKHLLGEAGTIGVALEAGISSSAVARTFGFDIALDIASVRLDRR